MADAQWNASSEDSGEHRKYRRLECGGTADIRVLPMGCRETGSLMNLSKRGCCFLSDEPMRGHTGSSIEVHIKVRGVDLRFPGVIRHVYNRTRAGIEFIELSERKCEQIEELIAELTELDKQASRSQIAASKVHEQDILARRPAVAAEAGARPQKRLLRFGPR